MDFALYELFNIYGFNKQEKKTPFKMEYNLTWSIIFKLDAHAIT